MLMMICYSSITLFILGKRPRLHSGTRHDAQSHSMEKRNFVAENDPGTNAGSQTESFIKNRYRKCVSTCTPLWGWSGGAKVKCILHHWGVQLILAYSWARPAILVVGKGRGGMFLFLLFLHFHSCSSFFPVPLFHLLYSPFYLFSPFLWETTQNDPQGLTCR